MIETTESLRNCPAPAKLNLFLHITGRRPDGYHTLQTVFQLIDWGDLLHFTLRRDGEVRRKTAVPGVPAASDLVVRAAALLKSHTGTGFGVDIEIDKRLPMGAGLGGGSSDAATTLLALNRLWQLDLPRETLQMLGLQLGADVPFFIFGRNAFAQGVGEALQPVALPERCFLVVTPKAHVPTAEIFSDKSLTRDSEMVTITDFLAQQSCSARWPDSFGRNDMQSVVMGKYAEVAQVLRSFESIAPARMTGSGSSVFAVFGSIAEAEAAEVKLRAKLLEDGKSDGASGWTSAVARSLDTHPLHALAS
ncbi:4-(cytidine 5'-diphospho)-2-C-methyl-D-erythritol kinase [Trinickia sp. LjRoot230]|uniref:4-(cytidine 5'-diphospho)-2-C-methyl-D-erythritol kinase n=1 Tax=Trinickia sp. LjRoot230 TaxID=3342288 RepID=UPI003ECEA038